MSRSETAMPNAGELATAPLRLLCVAAREPQWAPLTFELSATYGLDLRVVWTADPLAALGELRETCFDVVLLGETAESWRTSTAERLDFIEAVQTLEAGIPVVALLSLPDDHLLAELYGRDCDVCVSPRLWESPALPAVVIAAIRRGQRAQESQRLAVAHQRRLAREQADAASVLQLQQELLRGLQSDALPSAETSQAFAPRDWSERYDELLKGSILSGANRLTTAIAELVDALHAADRGPADVLALHIDRVRALSEGWGGRTSRHLVSRADLLALEVLTQLGERYRRQSVSFVG
jgi:hypothetical protein